MRQTVDKLEQFYVSKLGMAAQTMAVRRLHALWPHMNGLDVLSYGYGIPYLNTYEKNARSMIYAMPSGQGAVQYLGKRGNTSLLVNDHELPFAPNTFDRVLITHGLEETPNLPALFEEMWRVMKPEGRIVVIAANRTGLWARSDKTPFGTGRPFSRKQLSGTLKQAKFVPLVRSGALYCPPFTSMCSGRRAHVVEKFGETVWPGFSGLVLVEAVKRLYAGRSKGHSVRARRPKFSGAGVLGASQSSKTMAPNKEVS